MKVCPKCGQNHEKPGIYCSRKCANGKKWTKADKVKKSFAAKKAWENMSEEDKLNHREKVSLGRARQIKEQQYMFLFDNLFDDLGYQSKRIRVILEQDAKCNSCGLSEWMNKIITFELDHIDGNNQNNNRENLRALCPNCHSMTKTWRGKQNGMKQRKVLEAVKFFNKK